MRQIDAPELPEVEFLCNQIATELMVPVPNFYLIKFEGDLVFVTENFMHHSKPMDLQHIYHFREGTQHNCKGLISTITKYTKRPYDVRLLVRTILFDSLIGNHDRHGRNLGFLVMPNHTILAPIYDNVTYLSLESGDMLRADHNPTGRIATESTQEPNMRDYVLELCNLGYDSIVARFITHLGLKGMKKIDTLIENSFCSSLMKQAISKLIAKRYMEMQDGWQAYN